MDSKEEIYGFQIHSQEHDPDFKNTVSPQIMHIQTMFVWIWYRVWFYFQSQHIQFYNQNIVDLLERALFWLMY